MLSQNKPNKTDLFESDKIQSNLIPELNAYQLAINDVAIIATTNKKGDIIHVNDNFCKISGYSRSELIGKNHRIIKSDYHPPSFYKNIWKEITNGKTWRGEIKNKAKDGSFYWVDTIIVPILNEEKKPTNFLALRFDITDKKENELKIRESKNQQIILNSFKNKLIYTISHDIKSPLKSLLGLLYLLENKHLSKEEFKLNCIKISEKIVQCDNILDDLILTAENNYSIEKENEIIDFKDIVYKNKNIFEADLKYKSIKITTTFNQSKIVSSKKDIISIVTRNLISNAIKYSKNNKVIKIESEDCSKGVCFKVIDEGIGMDQATIKKMILNEKASLPGTLGESGSGIGLFLCRQFINDLGGEFIIESSPNKGSTIGFSLPS